MVVVRHAFDVVVAYQVVQDALVAYQVVLVADLASCQAVVEPYVHPPFVVVVVVVRVESFVMDQSEDLLGYCYYS